MRVYDRLALLALAAVWGCSFTIVKVGLVGVPPLLLTTLRFLFVAVPGALIVPRPRVPWNTLLLYGLLMFGTQSSLLFAAMYLGLSSGLASLTLQVQVFVTFGLATTVNREKPLAHHLLGALLAFAGLCILGFGTGGDVTGPGLVCALGAACAWGAANIVSKRHLTRCNPLAIVTWGSLVAITPVFGASLLFEGLPSIQSSMIQMSGSSAAVIAYIAYPTTLGGYAVWSWQIGRHPLATVAPYSLLVPIFSLVSAAIFIGEPLQGWKLASAGLVISGLAINQFGRRLSDRLTAIGVRR